jgi:hypothetical protein
MPTPQAAAATVPVATQATATRVPEPEAPPEPPVDPLKQSLDRMRESLSAGKEATAAKPPVVSTTRYIADAPPTAPVFDDSYDPLSEIADSADAAKMRGRPVGILVLSVRDSTFSHGVLATLGRKLAARGETRQASLDSTARAPQSVAQIISAMGGACDFLVIDGGHAGPGSAALAEAVALTVLVAPDDILDPGIDAVSRNLEGSNYFIVGPGEAAKLPA